MEQNKISFKSLLLKSIKLTLVILYLTIIISMIAGGISAGTLTLLPPDGFGWTVSKVNYLGYKSICAFVPFSSLMLFGMAFLGFFLLLKLIKYLRRKTKQSERYVEVKTLTNKIR
ncbi:MAG: hypothetical protein EAX91_18100 [Candidatus Lokiarchaeota archaeon]|nr:hypothetical protein [Candidatus Lokiarchaeota archaeon]